MPRSPFSPCSPLGPGRTMLSGGRSTSSWLSSPGRPGGPGGPMSPCVKKWGKVKGRDLICHPGGFWVPGAQCYRVGALRILDYHRPGGPMSPCIKIWAKVRKYFDFSPGRFCVLGSRGNYAIGWALSSPGRPGDPMSLCIKIWWKLRKGLWFVTREVLCRDLLAERAGQTFNTGDWFVAREIRCGFSKF